MLDWFVILTPLLVLGVVALLAFVGCDQVLGLNPIIPNYAIDAIKPNVGPSLGGTAVTLSGVNLSTSNRVTFGGVNALFKIVSESEIDAISPPNPVGPANVFALQPDGTQSTPGIDPNAPANITFTYVAIGFLQMQANSAAAGVSISVSLSNPATAGDILIAAVSHQGAGPITVKDNSGNVFISIGKHAWFQGQAEMFYLAGIAGGNVTVTATGGTAPWNICVSEYTGGASLGGFSANNSPNTGTVPENVSGVAVAPAAGNAAYVVVFTTQGSSPNLAAGAGFAGHSSPQDSAALAEDTMSAIVGGQVVATANPAGFVPWVVLAAEIQV